MAFPTFAIGMFAVVRSSGMGCHCIAALRSMSARTLSGRTAHVLFSIHDGKSSQSKVGTVWEYICI
jgi:hypothetical protein